MSDQHSSMSDQHSSTSDHERDRGEGMSHAQPGGGDREPEPGADGVLPGPHTGAPEDIPQHNTAPDGLPGGAPGTEDGRDDA